MGLFTQQEVIEYSNDLLIQSLKTLFDIYITEKHLPYSVRFLPYKPIKTLSLMSQNVIITHRLYKAKPGSLDGKPFSESTRDITTKDFVSTSEDGVTFEVSKQYVDMLIEFNIAAASVQYADKVTRIFSDFMLLAREPLRKHGISDVYFWERSADDAIEVKDDIYYTHTLQYFVRALYMMATPQDTIKQIAYAIEQIAQN